MIVFRVASQSRSVKSTSFALVKYRSMMCAIMSDAPHAVWYEGSEKVSSGFMIANVGIMSALPASLFCLVASSVITLPVLDSLPAAGIVYKTPLGIAFTISADPSKKSQTSPSYGAPTAIALAESITLPPPTDSIKSTLAPAQTEDQ